MPNCSRNLRLVRAAPPLSESSCHESSMNVSCDDLTIQPEPGTAPSARSRRPRSSVRRSAFPSCDWSVVKSGLSNRFSTSARTETVLPATLLRLLDAEVDVALAGGPQIRQRAWRVAEGVRRRRGERRRVDPVVQPLIERPARRQSARRARCSDAESCRAGPSCCSTARR